VTKYLLFTFIFLINTISLFSQSFSERQLQFERVKAAKESADKKIKKLSNSLDVESSLQTWINQLTSEIS